MKLSRFVVVHRECSACMEGWREPTYSGLPLCGVQLQTQAEHTQCFPHLVEVRLRVKVRDP